MSTDADIRELVRVAFSHATRPVHFTNYEHCSECKAHDDLLRARDVDSIEIEDVGNPGWDPICYISPEGFQYYFPAFVRLTLVGAGRSYLSQFLFHLTNHGNQNRRVRDVTPEQRRVVVAFLRHVADARGDIAKRQECEEDLQTAISVWSQMVDAR